MRNKKDFFFFVFSVLHSFVVLLKNSLTHLFNNKKKKKFAEKKWRKFLKWKEIKTERLFSTTTIKISSIKLQFRWKFNFFFRVISTQEDAFNFDFIFISLLLLLLLLQILIWKKIKKESQKCTCISQLRVKSPNAPSTPSSTPLPTASHTQHLVLPCVLKS